MRIFNKGDKVWVCSSFDGRVHETEVRGMHRGGPKVRVAAAGSPGWAIKEPSELFLTKAEAVAALPMPEKCMFCGGLPDNPRICKVCKDWKRRCKCEQSRREPIYIRVASRKVTETRELVPGRIMADFDADGNLIGVEVVG